MTYFIFSNWLLSILTSFLIVNIVIKHKYLLIKPSIVTIIFYHILIQWVSSVNSPYIEEYLPNPWVFLLLTQLFPLISIIVSFTTFRESSKEIWQRIININQFNYKIIKKAIFLLTLVIIIFIPIYLLYVPFHTTGLYFIFADPTQSAFAREYSSKLLDNSVIRYGFSFIRNSFAPILAVLTTFYLIQAFIYKRLSNLIISIIIIVGILLAVSLSGAREPAASIILTIIFALILNKKFKVKPIYIFPLIIIVLALPTIFTIYRESHLLTLERFWFTMSGQILFRLFNSTMETGLHHVHFTQTNGFFGIRGISKIAEFLGYTPINVPNYIFHLYADSRRIATGYANTSYVFAYYSYFGLVSFPLSLILLWLLDSLLYLYKRISNNLLIPCIAVVSINCYAFISTEYTTALISNGVLISLTIALIIDKFINNNKVTSTLHSTGQI
jgi:hypothetical protein